MIDPLTRLLLIPRERERVREVLDDDWRSWPAFDDGFELPGNSLAAVMGVYGDPRSHNGKGPDRKWERANMVLARNLPAIPRGKLYVHRKAEPRLREALRRVSLLLEDGRVHQGAIQRIGCFSYRHMRHDPARPLSRHSWGIAIDINPSFNRSRRFKRGQAPEAFGDEWCKLWPNGLPELIVRAFQSCGWAWGGDWDEDGTSVDHGYVDPMHMELVDRV